MPPRSRRAEVVAREGIALWDRASNAALKSGIFIRSGMQIPEEALAAIGADERGFTSDLLIARPEGIWRFSRGSESVRELAMVSEFLDMSLTILQFEDFVDLAEIADEEPRDTYDQFAAGEGS